MKKLLALLTIAFVTASAFAQDVGVTSGNIFLFAGVPSNGTSQIDTLTIGGTPTGGTFIITASEPGPIGTTINLRSTQPITWSATNATLLANINTALAAMNWEGASSTGVVATANSLTAGIGTITLTYGGILGKRGSDQNIPVLAVISSLTGTSPTAAITIATPGVTATFRRAMPGAILVDTVTPGLYFNSSATQFSPTWTSK